MFERIKSLFRRRPAPKQPLLTTRRRIKNTKEAKEVFLAKADPNSRILPEPFYFYRLEPNSPIDGNDLCKMCVLDCSDEDHPTCLKYAFACPVNSYISWI